VQEKCVFKIRKKKYKNVTFSDLLFAVMVVIVVFCYVSSSSCSSSERMIEQNAADAGKKREAYMIEMQKLRDGQSTSQQSAVQGRLTISDIKLPLKSEFMSKIGSVHGKLGL